MNKKQIKSQINITVGKFLRLYYEIDSEPVIEMLSHLSHKELKKMCKDAYGLDLQTLPFSHIEQEDINTGDIILVSDCFGNLAPYKNPYKPYKEYLEENAVMTLAPYSKNKKYIKRRFKNG
ncbi:MAG: hypothetical protein HFH47_02410 [Bacilli bacterium]|nr:hypothetical protein [Bacilli bacterium]